MLAEQRDEIAGEHRIGVPQGGDPCGSCSGLDVEGLIEAHVGLLVGEGRAAP